MYGNVRFELDTMTQLKKTCCHNIVPSSMAKSILTVVKFNIIYTIKANIGILRQAQRDKNGKLLSTL